MDLFAAEDSSSPKQITGSTEGKNAGEVGSELQDIVITEEKLL